jgi:protease IV
MKNVYESVLMNSLRAFFVTLFGTLGIATACLALGLTYLLVATGVKEESLPSKVKILADASGSRDKLSSSYPVLLQIPIQGEIGKDKLTGKHIEEILIESREDALSGRVKGILLVVNSPGGGVTDSDIIFRLLKEYKENYHIPIFAFVDGMCASGGLYIACAADQIFASDVSMIGSIGVLSWPPFMNLADALEKLGVNALTLSAGEGKDEMNPFRNWKPDEQKHYQSLINFYYSRFVDIVAESRAISKDTVIEKLGAKVFPAPEAVSIGLANASGASRSQVLKALSQAAGIEGKYQVVGFETETWWKKWLKEEQASPFLTGKLTHELGLPTHHGNPFSYIFKP